MFEDEDHTLVRSLQHGGEIKIFVPSSTTLANYLNVYITSLLESRKFHLLNRFVQI
jgi:hypothetical protein